MENIKILMAGNPNVGKSSLFNLFTGLHQHTGNWPGKTVGSAWGNLRHNDKDLCICDTPGTYSLHAFSVDERNAGEAIIFEDADCVMVVCDACCLERSLFLALQIMELHSNVLVCVNLMDEAEKKGISIDISMLGKMLGCSVIGVSAAKEENTHLLLDTAVNKPHSRRLSHINEELRQALAPLIRYFENYRPPLPAEWLAVQTAGGNPHILSLLSAHYGLDMGDSELAQALECSRNKLLQCGVTYSSLGEICALETQKHCAGLCSAVVKTKEKYRLSAADKILCKPFFSWLSMLGMLFAVLWLSIFAAEKPGQLVFLALSELGELIEASLTFLLLPPKIVQLLCGGIYSTCVWVISVMLPPMVIFFPLFTLLEDWGFLPRLAFNMDSYFSKCGSCGKQALTMCMGLGCNTVGISGCRIMSSPNEKIPSALTNTFMPCNGRFPMLISICGFMYRGLSSPWRSLASAATITGLIVLGILASFAGTWLLNKIGKEKEQQPFILEIPPFRRPQFRRSIARAIKDRTVFVLLRALKAAAPAGALIWILANTSIGGQSLLRHISVFLNPCALWIGMDGAILLAFILGLPASETVLPLILMNYLSAGTLASADSSVLNTILMSNGWAAHTCICVLIFTVMHWPCFSSLCAIREECGGRYILPAVLLPTVFGIFACAAVNLSFGVM